MRIEAPSLPSRLWLPWLVVLVSMVLGGCDMLGIESTSQIEARKTADGRAIGSACRHAVRSIEDCYRTNPKASRAAVFEGWREMDGYMRENNIQGMPYAASPSEVPAGQAIGKSEELLDATASRNGAKAASASGSNGANGKKLQ